MQDSKEELNFSRPPAVVFFPSVSPAAFLFNCIFFGNSNSSRMQCFCIAV